jgi:hypothetical protein
MFERLQRIDRRAVYIVLFLLMVALLKWPLRLPMVVSSDARGFYEAVERTDPSKLVLVAADWDAGTMAENGTQTEAVLRHLMRLHRRFAIMGFAWPAGPELTDGIARRLAPEYDYEYGRDWVNFGFKPVLSISLMTLVKDIPGFYKKDAKNTPVAELPALEGVRDIHDVSLIAQFTSAATLGSYIAFVWGPFKTPIVHGCTAVIGPQQYPYLDARQIEGLLMGVRGSAEYEALIGRPGGGTEMMPAQSFAHLLIIVLIIVGNIGYLGARGWRQRKAGGAEGA